MTLIRVTGRCNQRCRFCNVNMATECQGDLSPDQAIAQLMEAPPEPGGVVELSGGEPTLNPQLPEIINRIAQKGYRVFLETNAVALAQPDRAAALRHTGLDRAFVSLHGDSAELSDFLTGAPGTFHKTVEGIHNLLTNDIRVIINVVASRPNLENLNSMMRFIAHRFGNAPHISMSVMAPYEQAWQNSRELCFPYSLGAPFIITALDTANSLGMRSFMPDMCGVPPCFMRKAERHVDLLYKVTSGDVIETGYKVQGPACARCVWQQHCDGLWPNYVRLYGFDELRPVTTSIGRIAFDQLPRRNFVRSLLRWRKH